MKIRRINKNHGHIVSIGLFETLVKNTRFGAAGAFAQKITVMKVFLA
jgi:hypothetical protein